VNTANANSTLRHFLLCSIVNDSFSKDVPIQLLHGVLDFITLSDLNVEYEVACINDDIP
jgi:hypothetical protein